MITSQQWLSYWKKGLLDSMKAEIDPINYKESIHIPDFSLYTEELDDFDAVQRLIDAEEIRINKKQHIDSPSDSRWIKLNEVQVLIAPFRLNPIPQRQSYIGERKSLYPFWCTAMLNRNCRLSIPTEPYPFIPRNFLTPVVDDRIEYTIGDTEVFDRACAGGDFDFKKYQDYINHLLRIFEQVAQADLSSYRHENFVTDYTAHILVPDETMGAAMNLVKLYENLLIEENVPPLLNKLICLDRNPSKPPLALKEWLNVNERHLGQMKAAFPLSFSQRKSLYTLLANPDEQVMAINGPPGTGKTTLLQSVVANAMVESVLTGVPKVILACSANNQAVTNIIDSFTKKDEELEIRWLPDVEGYATYLPSASKPVSALRNINYVKPDGDGLFSRLETPEYLRKARGMYLKQAAVFFEEELLTVDAVLERLYQRITAAQETLKSGSRVWSAYCACKTKWESDFLSILVKKEAYKAETLSPSQLEKDLEALEDLTEKVLYYFRKESLFRKIGCWLRIRSAQQNRRAELTILFRRSILRPEIFAEEIFSSAEVLMRIDGLIALVRKTLDAVCQWDSWQSGLEQEWPELAKKDCKFFRHNPSDVSTAFYDALDTTLRYRAFVDAVHYWEGRWLNATAKMLIQPPASQRKRGEEAVKSRWRHRAMLTPCFVSTFYMAPRFFDFARYLGKDSKGKGVFENPTLTNYIDYLIVDEAGQVPPEVGAGVFAMAQRAIVVGDIKQIEPVWSILPKVDLGNLKKEGLLDGDEKIATDIYEPKGFLSSSGSMMQMAQNACSFAEDGCTEGGLMLVEHRRCYDEIIEYCNELAYHGLLRPLRGPAKEDKLFLPMLCIHVEGKSMVRNKARFNDFECDAICKWLTEHKAAIEKKYIDGKNYLCIEDIVGVLTPFVGQKNHLRTALRKAGFDVDRFKLGTVHALQGAERPIVLFSAVYGPGEVGTMFFDIGGKPNMLNVAVSRAKDSFIVFANTKIFDPKMNTPSGILAKHLTQV